MQQQGPWSKNATEIQGGSAHEQRIRENRLWHSKTTSEKPVPTSQVCLPTISRRLIQKHMFAYVSSNIGKRANNRNKGQTAVSSHNTDRKLEQSWWSRVSWTNYHPPWKAKHSRKNTADFWNRDGPTMVLCWMCFTKPILEIPNLESNTTKQNHPFIHPGISKFWEIHDTLRVSTAFRNIVNLLIPFTFWVKDAFYGTASFASVPSVSQSRSPLTTTFPCNCLATTNVPKSALEHRKISRTQFAIMILGEGLINHMQLQGTAKNTQRCAFRINATSGRTNITLILSMYRWQTSRHSLTPQTMRQTLLGST